MDRKIVKNLLFGFLTGWVIASASPAFAAGEFYAGGSIGHTAIVDLCGDENEFVGPFGLGCDETDAGWKILAGYRATPHLGFEIDYVDLDSAGATWSSLDLTGFGLAATFSALPSEQFSVFAKVGMWQWDADPFREDGSDLRFGVGAQFRFQNPVGLRTEWERFEVDDGEADLWSFGVTFALK